MQMFIFLLTIPIPTIAFRDSTSQLQKSKSSQGVTPDVHDPLLSAAHRQPSHAMALRYINSERIILLALCDNLSTNFCNENEKPKQFRNSIKHNETKLKTWLCNC